MTLTNDYGTNEVHELPESVTQGGLDFSYAVWTPGTIATLCNVPWNSDYRDIVYYNNRSQLDAYIDGKGSANIVIPDMSYARPGNPIRINLPLNRVMRFNYIRVHNPVQPVPGDDVPRTFYYFITDVRHLAPNTTEIYVQLDVVQSFIYDVTFGRSYVEAGHIGIANENAFANYGRSFLTTPEGFDLGNEYEIRRNEITKIAETHNSATETGFGVLVMSTVNLSQDPGTVESPNLTVAAGSYSQGLPNGASLYYFDGATTFRTAIQRLSDYPWITQGIVGVWAFPKRYEVDYTPFSSGELAGLNGGTVGDDPSVKRQTKTMTNWRNQVADLIANSRYRHLKKFLTYPYCVVEITTYSGNPLMVKPESWQDDDGTVIELGHWTPPNVRLAFYPFRYNAGKPGVLSNEEGVLNDGGDFLDFTTGITNVPMFSVVNNSYLGYLASNANSINYQYDSADWSQQRTLTGAQLAYNQASQAMGLSGQLTELGVNAATSRTQLANQFGTQRAVVTAVGQIAGGVASGNPIGIGSGLAGAASTAINTGIDINQRNAELAVSNNYARQTNSAQVANQAYNRDTNQEYAAYAANGDYRNSIAAINAKVQDAKMIQPTTSGQMGGDSFNLAMYQWSLDVKVKMVNANVMAMIGEHWLRYGYAINRYFNLGKRLHCMTRFTYWKLQECTITSAPMPETFKQTIRGIFEKGVTVWRNPADIGTLDPVNNDPESGFLL